MKEEGAMEKKAVFSAALGVAAELQASNGEISMAAGFNWRTENR